MKRYLLLFLFTNLLIASVSSQANYRFRNYTINDGLSQSSVTCLIQDDLNSLWIGTQDGLNKFDGKTFEVFLSDDTDGLENSYIKSCAKDAEGNLWFGTNKGLTMYSVLTEKFTTYTISKKQSFQIEEIAIDEDDLIWISSAESGLYYFNTKTKAFVSYSDVLNSKKTKTILVLENKTLLVSTEDKGLFIVDTGAKEADKIQFNGVSTLIINKFIHQVQGGVLLATNRGVFELNTSTKKTTERFTSIKLRHGEQNVSDIFRYEDIGWFISTSGNGLFTLYDSGEIQHNTEDIFQKNALLYNQLNLIFYDNSKNLWIGSQRGLTTFNPSKKGILGVGPSGNDERGIPTASVWSFAEKKQGKYLYIGTDTGVSRLNRETGLYRQFYRSDNTSYRGAGEFAVLSIYIINDSHLLVGCADGFFELKIGNVEYKYSEIVVPKEEGEPNHKRAYSIVHWKDSLCFVGTKDGVVLYDYGKKDLKVFEHSLKNPKNTIGKGICRLVYKDNQNNVWFATSTGGLNLLSFKNENLLIKPYEHNSEILSVSSNYITSIYHSKENVYWMGTFGTGLIKWKPNTKEAVLFNKSNGLPNDVIYGVLIDKKNTLWLSTNEGLCSFNAESYKIRNFTEDDGLMSNEFNIGAHMLSYSGEAFFGGIYGYNYFNPQELTINTQDIKVVFTKFKLENDWLRPSEEGSPLEKPIFQSTEIKLPYEHRSFTLRFQPSDLSNPEKINYKYILEGSVEGEILIGGRNEIHFSSLAPGDYVLKVYSRIGEDKWSSVPAIMQIYVAQPYWSTWWFITIIGLIVTFLGWRYVRQRMSLAKRTQEILERKVIKRTREIRLKNEKIEEQAKLLKDEKDKTEKLLKRIIPESTAEELKQRGSARARAYKKVSVLFTDFVGFTRISERMNPTELVKRLDVYFTKFDEIIIKNNLEKIKTIGDAYMCAGGVPVRNNTNPIDTCTAALQIQAYILQRKTDAIANDDEYWELRLGINTGEVTAGVIGSERLAYDIWGATVNQAQRMEMLGAPGEVTITGTTYQFIEPYFDVSFKGKAQTKSKGLINMYVVEQIKPELSVNGEGVFPNSRFHDIVNLHHYSSINYYKAERHIMKVLEEHLSDQLHYHSIAHTKDVVRAIERIALLEDVTDEGLFLLKSAATYHDAGFIEQYDNNEPVGARLAHEILPKYGYTDEDIEKIKELIYVTEIPHNPKNKLEEIICDADLDYLGRDDFHEISDRLKRELIEHKKIKNSRQWDEIQVSFLESHKYFTETAINSRRKKKQENLEEVKERLKKNEYTD